MAPLLGAYMARTKDVSGVEFGELTAIYPTDKRKWNYVVWRCKCSCGGEKDVPLPQLTRGQTRSCGCLKKDPPKNYKPDGVAAEYRLFTKYRANARKRGQRWEISREEFAEYIRKNCFYCGCPPSTETNYGANGEVVYNGIDRIDNAIGYVQDNCVSCCKDCNFMKGSLSLVDFTRMVSVINTRLKLT